MNVDVEFKKKSVNVGFVLHDEAGIMINCVNFFCFAFCPGGNVFTHVCHSVHGEGCLSQHAPQSPDRGGLCPGGVSVQGWSMSGGGSV